MTNLGRLGISRFLRAALCFTAACLIVMQAAQAQTYTVLHSFAGGPTDGAYANGELIQDAAGNLYGTTTQGGTDNLGTVFKLDPSGAITILHSFTGGKEGAYPLGGLLRDPEGNFYGTASTEGAIGDGTIFKLDTTGALTTLHSFGGDDGAGPRSRLITIDGYLYGITQNGGSSNCSSGCGVIFKVTKGGTETVLHRFTGGADGAFPQNVIRDSAGNLYGVATSSAAPGAGTVWKFDTAGVFSTLYTFNGNTDGGTPMGRLIRDNTNGTLRGTTASGGDPTCNCGVVYSVNTSGNEVVIHKFFTGGGGAEPFVGLLDVGGTLYGTTISGGGLTCSSACGGVLFQIGKTGRYTVLHRFAGLSSGDGYYNFIGSLSLGADGGVFGATWWGGTGTNCSSGASLGCGTTFKYAP